MSEVVLFHHVQGLTGGVRELGDALRAGGHTVHTPDLFDGRTFATLEEGMAFARETGFDTIAERGLAAAADLPAGVVYAGISLGVMPAQQLAQTRPDAGGAIFLCGCLPVEEFGTWPAGVPVQVHGKESDPFFDEDLAAARALAESAADSELVLYPGEEHLFVDASLPSYDPAATSLLVERALSFLERVPVNA
jgi:dienelactone hydrolase